MGETDLDARTDVFALGCVLFECLSGQPVVSGATTWWRCWPRCFCDEAPRVRSLRPELAEALDELLARMLSKNRAARPQDGEAVSRDLVALGEMSGGPPRSRQSPLSGGEQRMTSVILATVPDEGMSEVVQRHGGDIVRLANGALLVTLGGRGTASEQAMIAAASLSTSSTSTRPRASRWRPGARWRAEEAPWGP